MNVNERKKLRIGIDVGGTKIAYGLFDEDFKLLARTQTKSNAEMAPEDVIDQMKTDVYELINSENKTIDDLYSVGACFPSFIDKKTGQLAFTSNLPRWTKVKIDELLQEKFNVKVAVDNDANAAAIGEHEMGAGVGKKDMIYVTVSSGVGGGIIINDSIFSGTYGMAGEIGHVFVSDDKAAVCGMGHVGCVEAMASGINMAKYAAAQIASGRSSIISSLADGREIDGRILSEAVKLDDALALETIDRSAYYLARMFASLFQCLNIDHIVYGGGAFKISPKLIEMTIDYFMLLCPFAKDYPMNFVPASLGDDVGIIGAALLCK